MYLYAIDLFMDVLRDIYVSNGVMQVIVVFIFFEPANKEILILGERVENIRGTQFYFTFV